MNGVGRKEQDNKNKSLILTKETLGVVLVLFSTLCLICLITRETLFSTIGQYVNAFLFGCFGFFAYAVILTLLSYGILCISGKALNISTKRKVLFTLFFLVLSLISHVATASPKSLTFSDYVSVCYNMGDNGISSTSAGGIFTGMLAYLICAILTDVGSYVVLGLAISFIGYFLIKDFVKEPSSARKERVKKFKTSFVKEEDLGVMVAGEKEYPVDGVDFSVQPGKQKLFVNNANEFNFKNKREMQKDAQNGNSIKFEFSQGGLAVVKTQSSAPQQQPVKPAVQADDYKKKLDYIKTPTVIDMEKYSSTSYFGNTYSQNQTKISDYVSPRQESTVNLFSEQNDQDIPFIEHDTQKTESISGQESAEQRAEMFNERYLNNQEIDSEETPFVEIEKPVEINNYEQKEEIPFIQEEVFEEKEQPIVSSRATRFDFNKTQPVEEEQNDVEDLQEQTFDKTVEVRPTESNITTNERVRSIFFNDEEKEQAQSVGFTSRVNADNNQTSRRSYIFDQPEKKVEEFVEEKKEKVVAPINREYYRPPFDLLESYAQPINAQQENHEERMEIIKRTLEQFKIEAETKGFVQGPSITRYEIMMPAGISVKNILRYDDDLKMRLSAKNGVRIEAPIPGKDLVGIEVANNVKVTVGLKEVMQDLSEKKSKPGALMFALGKDIVGNAISDDLTKGPHYLIAGATGSGKSVALHVMLVSLLMRYSPEELKLVLIDPKCVEFRKYEHLPHLLVDEIITEPKRALALLQWAYDETNRRNDMFTACGGHISNIDDYNSMIANDKIAKLPRIVFVIDELADLMEACKKDLEERIRKIAAKSRSAGIHLVLATQRPSVDVITGTIKANLPSRIALKVMNFADSQTILGGAGAEKLLGNGDMLYRNSSMADYERYQGAYISGREISNIVEYIKEKNTAYFDDDVKDFLEKETRPQVEEAHSMHEEGGSEEFSEQFLKALWFAVKTGSISISSLQRRFSIGYPTAGKIIDRMEHKGFISPNEGSKARKVLMTTDEYISRFGPGIEDEY